MLITDGGELHFSGSIDSNTLRSNAALLVNIEFEAVGAGVSEISGYIELLGSTSVPPVDIGNRGTAFVAGRVHQTVSGGGQRRVRGVPTGAARGGLRALAAAQASRSSRSPRKVNSTRLKQ